MPTSRIPKEAVVADATKTAAARGGSLPQRPQAKLMSRTDLPAADFGATIQPDEIVSAEMPIGPGKFWVSVVPKIGKAQRIHTGLTHDTFMKMSDKADDAWDAFKKGFARVNNTRDEINVMFDSKSIGTKGVRKLAQQIQDKGGSKMVYFEDLAGKHSLVTWQDKLIRKLSP